MRFPHPLYWLHFTSHREWHSQVRLGLAVPSVWRGPYPRVLFNVNMGLIVNAPCKCAYLNILLNRKILTGLSDLTVNLRDAVVTAYF